MVKRRLGEPQHLAANGDSAFIECFNRDLIAFAEFAENGARGNLDVVQNQFGSRGRANAKLVFFFAHLEAGRISLDQETSDAFVAGGRVDGSENQKKAGLE